MSEVKNAWQIWVDTGGTFTDCCAINPEGKEITLKILSSSCLRGTLLKHVSQNKFLFEAKWSTNFDIFNGFTCNVDGLRCEVKSIDFKEKIINLDKSIDLEFPCSFEITSYEEAPVLAARIITNTALNEPFPPIHLRLATTKGTNALLERKGAKCLLVLTKGFKDLLEIGNQQRPNLFQLNIPNRKVLYDNCIVVDERINTAGNVVKKLTETEINELVEVAINNKYTSCAIALINAYKNPKHEQLISKALKKAGIKYVSNSAELSTLVQILPRAETALVNAYLSPILNSYLNGIQHSMKSAEIKVMTSAGGLVDINHFLAKDSLLSGPAGATVAAARIARACNLTKVIVLDMGGTSTDASIYDDQFHYTSKTKVADAEIYSTAISINTVAAGGGSICSFDGTQFKVGPESASAFPGPACYGEGGPLTITDVNLLLGKMNEDNFSIPVIKAQAKKALVDIQQKLKVDIGVEYSEHEILEGFEKIANEKMADAIKQISISKGIDPKAFTLIAVGGAGGMHACKIAELLQINQIILPGNAGVFSAFGIGQARVERIVTRQLLVLLEKDPTLIQSTIESLEQEAQQLLLNESIELEDCVIKSCLLYLRFESQQSTLELEILKEGQQLFESTFVEIEQRFNEKYTNHFGYFPKGKHKIEVERIKLIVATKAEEILRNEQAIKFYHPTSKQQDFYPVYQFEALRSGAIINGPAVLQNESSTAFINENWQLKLDEYKHAHLTKVSQHLAIESKEKEAVALELFTQRFAAIADAMGEQLRRTSFSVNVKERLDFSCAILDPAAMLLVNAPHIPVHLGSLGVCARLILTKFEIGPGDVIITNHPAFGGSHLPDVTLLSAVFDEDNRLIAYLINRAHHAEIGGILPGSMPPNAKSLEEEGVVLAPFFIVKNNVFAEEVLMELLSHSKYPSRSISENVADIKAALASLKRGEIDLKKLVKHHGLAKVHHYMTLLKSHTHKSMKNKLRQIGDKSLTATEFLDDGHQIQVNIKIENEQLNFDFKGSSGIHPGNLNANLSIVHSAIIYVLRLLIDIDIPLNEGIMESVNIETPESFLNPTFHNDPAKCPAVVGGNTEVSQRLVDTLLKAFEIVACSQGTMNNFLFGNENFGYYETVAGGCGAGNGFHGRSGVHQHMTNTKITDPEEIERRYPVSILEFNLRSKSGGQGLWSGGEGVIRKYEFHDTMEVTIISQHRKEQPYGLNEGSAGQTGEQWIIRKGSNLEQLKGIDTCTVNKGDIIILKTPGGGAFGKNQST